MIGSLGQLDLKVFLLLNGEWVHPWLDWFMPRLTLFFQAGYPFFIMCALVMALGRWRGLMTGLLMPVGLGLALFVTRGWLKPFFERVRPFAELGDVRLLIPPPESFSFPSTHATVAFAVACIVALRHRPWGYILVFWALMMAYTRVYVGVHYPLDILAGACTGWVIGGAVVLTESRIRRVLGRVLQFGSQRT